LRRFKQAPWYRVSGRFIPCIRQDCSEIGSFRQIRVGTVSPCFFTCNLYPVADSDINPHLARHCPTRPPGPSNEFIEVLIMSRVCQVTGKRPVTGNNVSHAKNRTRRRFLPNLHHHRFWVESENRWVRLRVSANGMRIIDKKGIDVILTDLRARGEKF